MQLLGAQCYTGFSHQQHTNIKIIYIYMYETCSGFPSNASLFLRIVYLDVDRYYTETLCDFAPALPAMESSDQIAKYAAAFGEQEGLKAVTCQ